MFKIHQGDNRDILAKMIKDGVMVDSVLTDPPYHLKQSNSSSKGFMGKTWDGGGIAQDPEFWKLVYQVLKPGGYLLSFAATRTYHRMACAIEDSGFEIRDFLLWLYGSGFPKSMNIGKAIQKKVNGTPVGASNPLSPNHGKFKGGCSEKNETGQGFGAGPGSFMDQEGIIDNLELTDPDAIKWKGWGTALKPAYECICLARKPLSEPTVVDNILKHNTGGINIDATRINSEDGRFPSNLILDTFIADILDEQSGQSAYPKHTTSRSASKDIDGFQYCGGYSGQTNVTVGYDDAGGASRFFKVLPIESDFTPFYYSAKASKKERRGSKHPTIKPIKLLQYLSKLVTPENGTILDPFGGTGTTGESCLLEGFDCILIEKESEYIADIESRMNAAVEEMKLGMRKMPTKSEASLSSFFEDAI